MTLIAKAESEGSFTPVPPGTYLARCYRIVDLGTQESEWQGTVKHLHKIMLQFEVHGEDDVGKAIVTNKGEPMTISKNFTLSLGEKSTLRKDLVSWRGRDFTSDELSGFELKNVLGAWAMISVIKSVGKNGKNYTNISSISAVPSALKKNLPQAHNKTAMFAIEDADMELFNTFSEGLKKKIMSSPEWESIHGVQPEQRNQQSNASQTSGSFDDMDDDIPF